MANESLARPWKYDTTTIKAILWDYGMHEPDCPARQVKKAQKQTDMHLTPQPCDCWLSAQIDGQGASDA